MYVKKNLFGEYDVVYPLKNEDGTQNWKHTLIGSWGQFTGLIIILAIMAFLLFSYSHDIEECAKLIENPFEYCGCKPTVNDGWDLPTLNISVGDKDGKGI